MQKSIDSTASIVRPPLMLIHESHCILSALFFAVLVELKQRAADGVSEGHSHSIPETLS